MEQVFTNEQVRVLKQFTQEDVEYVKTVVQGRKNSTKHYDEVEALLKRAQSNTLTSEDIRKYGGYYFPFYGEKGIKIPMSLSSEEHVSHS